MQIKTKYKSDDVWDVKAHKEKQKTAGKKIVKDEWLQGKSQWRENYETNIHLRDTREVP